MPKPLPTPDTPGLAATGLASWIRGPGRWNGMILSPLTVRLSIVGQGHHRQTQWPLYKEQSIAGEL